MISIIMSVYNSDKFLENSISSILNQTYGNFEFLIIDDCSTDSSYSIIKRFAKKDKRIRFFKNSENLGLTKNLNKLVELANRNYIARMDADDVSLPDRLKIQMEFLNNNPTIDIVGSYSQNISENGDLMGERRVPVKHEDIIKLLPKLNPLSHPTVMFRASALKKIGGYSERYKTSQDFHLWYKAAGNKLKFYNIPEVLLYYRMNDNYVSRKSFKYRLNEFNIKIEGYKLIEYPWYKYYNALLSLILALIPSALFNIIKKLDPR